MSKGKFGEPWEAIYTDDIREGMETDTRIDCADGASIGTLSDGGKARRAVACVNALDGFDPAKARALLHNLCAAESTVLTLGDWQREAHACRENKS